MARMDGERASYKTTTRRSCAPFTSWRIASTFDTGCTEARGSSQAAKQRTRLGSLVASNTVGIVLLLDTPTLAVPMTLSASAMPSG